MNVVKVQRVSFAIAGGSASGTGTLSGFTDLDQMVIAFASWSIPDVAQSNEDRVLVDFDVTNLTTITATRNGTPAGEAVNVEAYVVEFDTDTNVYKGTFSLAGGANTENQTTTANINGGSPMALNDLTKAFGWLYYRGVDTGANDLNPANSCIQMRFTSTSVLTFERDYNTAEITSGHWFVVESSTLSVQHEAVIFTGANATDTDTFTSPVTLANSFIIGSYLTDESGFQDEGIWTIDLSGTQTARFRRGFGAGEIINAYYMVVTDTSITTQRGDFAHATTGANATLSPTVDTDYAVPLLCGGMSFSAASDSWGSGNFHTRTHEAWISASNQIDVASAEGASGLVLPWQVIEFSAGGAPPATPRRVMVIT